MLARLLGVVAELEKPFADAPKRIAHELDCRKQN